MHIAAMGVDERHQLPDVPHDADRLDRIHDYLAGRSDDISTASTIPGASTPPEADVA